MPMLQKQQLFSADKSPMEVKATIEIDVKVGGVTFPFVFLVIERLGFDAIFGLDLLEETEAAVRVKDGVLELFDGLTSVPMSVTGSHILVSTIATVNIPPFSEAIIPTRPNRQPYARDYMMEAEFVAPKASLMVARVLVDGSKRQLLCRVLNPTNRMVKLRAGTIIGKLSPVREVHQSVAAVKCEDTLQQLSIAEMCEALKAKKLILDDITVTGEDYDNLIRLLYKNIDLFATSLAELPGCDVLLYRIDTGDSPPIHRRSYRHTPADREEIARQTRELLDAGIIEESDTPWSAPVLLITKGDGSGKRFVVDYRFLNEVCALIKYPFWTIDQIIDSVGEQNPTLWCSIDLRSGFFQLKLDPETKFKSGFFSDESNYIFNRLPQGLAGSPAHFSAVMHKVLKGMSPSMVIIYLDDILVMAKNPSQMLERLGLVFDRFRAANLRMHPSKCHWAKQEIKFLGYIFSNQGIRIDESKVKIVREFPIPDTPKKVRRYLGLTTYVRRFVKNYSQITEPLRKLLRQNTKFVWTEECEQAFQELKRALTTAPVLALPRFDRKFILTTDSSLRGLAYILSQRDDGGREHIVCYGGRGLRGAESRYTISEIEALAVIEGIKQYHTYLAGNNEFEIVTDHAALTFLKKMKLSNINNRLTRWALFLQGYNFKITHRPGSKMAAVDALSRIDWPTEETKNDQEKGQDETRDTELGHVAAMSTPKERILITFNAIGSHKNIKKT